MKAMQKNPKSRYSSAQAMLNDIDRFRLNPSIIFGYKLPKADEQTKYVDPIDEKKKADDTRRVGTPSNEIDGDDDDSEEKLEKKVRTPKQAAVIGVIVALVITIVGFGVYLGYNAITGGASDIEVPDFVGKNIVDVRQDNSNNFHFTIDFDYDSTQKEGVILSQKPEAESKMVKQGATIELTVNGQNSEVTVPHLINTTEENAINTLESRNLIPEVVYIQSDDVNVDYVSSEFPTPGEKATIGSTVYVYVSKGPVEKKVTIPDVTGMSFSEAEQVLNDKGLNYEYEYDEESYEEKDTVIRQNPLQGGKVKKGYTVKLILSGGKKDSQSLDISVQLPTDETNNVSLQVLVDGQVYVTTNLVPSESKTYNFTVTGTGTATKVQVYLNGQLYQEYTIDFQNKSVGTPVYHDYVVATTTTPDDTTESSSTEENSTSEPQTTVEAAPTVTAVQPTTETEAPEPTTEVEDSPEEN
jgi:serine/threonine-protein kinase